MSTPKGTRCRSVKIGPQNGVHVYSKGERIVLQLRRQVPTESNLLSPSFKVGVRLTPSEAAEVGNELLAVARKAGFQAKRSSPG